MECLLFPLLIVAALVAIVVARWISRPIESLARSRQAREQFTVADMLVLFAMLQLAVGTVHYLATPAGAEPGSAAARDEVASPIPWVADAVATPIILLSWWCGVSMVSRAGIDRWWHRAVILGLVVPFGSVGLVALIFLVLFAVGTILMAERVETPLRLAVCLLAAAAAACGAVTRWIAAQYPLGQPAKPLDSEDAPRPRSTPMEE